MGTAVEMGRTADGRRTVYSTAIRSELIVSACGWTREAEAEFGIDAIVAGDVAPDRYWTATQDGRGVIVAWHEGAASGVEVYYERWSAEAGYAHGWIDAVSRRIVQAG